MDITTLSQKIADKNPSVTSTQVEKMLYFEVDDWIGEQKRHRPFERMTHKLRSELTDAAVDRCLAWLAEPMSRRKITPAMLATYRISALFFRALPKTVIKREV